MKINAKAKFILNILALVLIFGIMFYLIKNSLSDILTELKETRLVVLVGVVFLGIAYQFFEGWSIRSIVAGFSRKFRIFDGMLTAFYVAFYRVITFGMGTLISEINFYNRKGIKVSQGMGVAALHIIMYKGAILTYAIFALIIQFSLFYEHAPKMIPLILLGMVMTGVIISFFLVISISLKLQVVFVMLCHRFLKTKKMRDFVDRCNIQIYSLRETVSSVLKDRTALIKFYLLNLLKLSMWYTIVKDSIKL